MKSFRQTLFRHPISQFIKRASLAAARLLVIAAISWLILRWQVGDRWKVVRLGSYFAPWLLIALLPAFLVALITRQRWFAAVVLGSSLFFGAHYWSLFSPQPPQVKAEETDGELRMMTFNVHYANRNAQEIAEMIQTEQPDIIAMQEVTEALASALLPKLASEYPYHLSYDWGLPLTLISRYPLTRQAKPVTLARAQHATVETPRGIVTVWNIHPSTAVGDEGWQAQRQTLKMVATEIEGIQGPLVVMGDFNTTPEAENFEPIAGQLTDVHSAVGRGFGFTFPDTGSASKLPWYFQPVRLLVPLVRIDHILVSQHFIPQETYVIPSGLGSDHRPVVATLRLTD